MSSANLAVGVKSFAIVPHASTTMDLAARAIYVGTAGNVEVVHRDGTSCIWPNVPAGGYILCEAVRVNPAGTTASNLVGVV